jgi:hypothetical protein
LDLLDGASMDALSRNWLRILIWAVVLGSIASIIVSWGQWDKFFINWLWRILIVALGGIVGLLLNYFGGTYVGMGTNIIESMGVVRFSDDTPRKIENSFVFVGALVAAIASAIFIR